MIYFSVIPLYWLSGIACYLASERQQLTSTKGPLLSTRLAVCICLLSVCTATALTWYATNHLIESIVMQLLFLMLFIPAPVFLLTHKPQWLKLSTLSIVTLCLFIQFAV